MSARHPSMSQDMQDIADRVASLSRAELVVMLKSKRCGFRMDFTDEYLRSISLTRLRHIVIAASLQEARSGGPKPVSS